MVTEDRLRTTARVAESARRVRGRARRARPGLAGVDARFIVALARGAGRRDARAPADDDEHRLLIAAVHAYLDDFGHEEADVLRRVKELHAKAQQA